MKSAILNIKKSRGRPKTNTTGVMVRLSADMLEKIDALRAKHDPQPSRPEAIRQALEATFKLMGD